MSAEQVRDEAVTVLLAGHETTANGLTWTWYLLSQHPDVAAQLRAEVFYALNHPNFQVPVFLLDRSNVGQLTQTANEAREFQLALKLLF